MCGMQRTTVSPSSSSTRRSTPCVAGCCGPRLMSMCSPDRSGSSDGGASRATGDPPSSTSNGTRCGRPAASRPVVDSSTSTVRFEVAIRRLLSRLLTRAQAASHVVRQVIERLRDRELLFRVPRLRVRGQRLPQLLGTTEPSAQRKILAQWKPLPVLLPHQQASQVRMPNEANAEHVEALALEPIGAAIHLPHTRYFQWRTPLDLHLEPKKASIRQ